MEPLSVAVNAVCKIAKITAVDNVAIFGAGPVGLLYVLLTTAEYLKLMSRTMAVCKAMGARRIIAIDVSQGRLDFAKRYAATDIHLSSPMNDGEERGAYSRRHVCPACPKMVADEKAELISKVFGLSDRDHTGIDVVLDCSGAEVCIQTGMWLLKRKGKFIQVRSFLFEIRGWTDGEVGNGALYCNVPMLLVGNKELNVLGVFRVGLVLTRQRFH